MGHAPRLCCICLAFIVVTGAHAQGPRDATRCSNETDSLKRLACFDQMFPKSAQQVSGSKFVKMDIIDFMTDFNSLLGKSVETEGFGIILGDNLLLYQAQGAMNAAWIDSKNVGREQRRAIFSTCTSGCTAIVRGKAAKVMLQTGIVADEIIVR